MSFLFNNNTDVTPLESTLLESTLLESLEHPTPSSVLSSQPPPPQPCTTNTDKPALIKPSVKCYYGDSSAPNLHFFYGYDIPKNGQSCDNGLFSYGQQTQMHPISFLFKYPYLHPIAIIYSFLFLWSIHFRIRIITIIIVIFIQLTIGESLKIHRQCSMATFVDKSRMIAQFIGDILLIPYQWFIYPTENPLIQFQNTTLNRFIFSNCKSILKFSPTFWMRNTMAAFIWAVLEEQYERTDKYKVYRECVQTPDGGLIALDWWVNKEGIDETDGKDDDEEDMAEFEDVYQSKTYYKYKEENYKKYDTKMENGDDTPILFVFVTYSGDSMSAPVRKMCDYFCSRGWRVIAYIKRGGGSPYFETLPLTNHKVFDLSGMDDALLAIQRVVDRYPTAPKVALGFSVGGSQLQDYLVHLNSKHNHFIGGIKIDGINVWTELLKFGVEKNLISKILGEVVHSSYIKSLLIEDDCKGDEVIIDQQKVALWQKAHCDDGFDFEKIAKIKSAECEIIDVVREIMCPAKGIDDEATYLQSVGPGDPEGINVPTLVFNSWNDGFQDPTDMPIGIANVNPNIFHCVTRLGSHCIRREGILNRECWQSKVSFEFASAVVNAKRTRK